MTIQLSDETRALADKFHIRLFELEIIADATGNETVGIMEFPDEDAREQRAAIVDAQGDLIFSFAPYPLSHTLALGTYSPGFGKAFREWCMRQEPMVIPF